MFITIFSQKGGLILSLLRLDKIISDMGFASRRDVKTLIKNGRVLLNGSPAPSGDIKCDPYKSIIEVKGERLIYRQYRYIMMNKPAGYICAARDSRERTVMELLDERSKRQKLFTVGRLDKDTQGLLIITNDGDYAHKIISPKSNIIKRYYAKVAGELGPEDILKVRSGLVLGDGTRCLPAELVILSSAVESECEIAISEGKYHQVKRMLASLGKPVTYLKRLSIGGLMLDDSLDLGASRELTEEERALTLLSALNGQIN